MFPEHANKLSRHYMFSALPRCMEWPDLSKPDDLCDSSRFQERAGPQCCVGTWFLSSFSTFFLSKVKCVHSSIAFYLNVFIYPTLFSDFTPPIMLSLMAQLGVPQDRSSSRTTLPILLSALLYGAIRDGPWKVNN